MRVLVTGGAGFVGSHLAEHLLEKGHEVAVIDDLSRGALDRVPNGSDFYQRDIRLGCDDVFEEFRPEVVSHQAAQVDVQRSLWEPDDDAEVNILGTLKLLQSCIRYGVKRFVFASTCAVYGKQESFPASENHPLRPISPYGISKLSAESYLRFYEDRHDLSCVTLRYANVYGPFQSIKGEAGVVAIFAKNLANGVPCTIYGTGEQTRDYVYVGDVARAGALAVEGVAASGTYNIGTGIEISVNQVYEVMRELSNQDILPEHSPARPSEQLRSSVNPQKAAQLLNWRSETDLETGFKKTLRNFGAPYGRIVI